MKKVKNKSSQKQILNPLAKVCQALSNLSLILILKKSMAIILSKNIKAR